MLTLRLRKIIEILNTIIIFFGLNLVWVNFVVNKYLKMLLKIFRNFHFKEIIYHGLFLILLC